MPFRPLSVAFGLLVTALAADDLAAESPRTFVNPIYAGQDPFVFKHGPDYFQAATESVRGERSIAVYRSRTLLDRGMCRTVYTAPRDGKFSSELWAPEIHHLRGKWYIYTCADDGDNANHRSIVLEADTDDPQGSYHFAAELDTPWWAIDSTVFEGPDGKLYCLWSGWPVGTEADSTQHLFISAMSSPTKLVGTAVDISGRMYDWECVERPAGLNEGPQALVRDGRVYVMYAASGSWTPNYCLGMLSCSGEKLLEAAAWVKHPQPAFSKRDNVYGPGHGCMVKSPDESEDWLIYHSSIDPEGSWNRCISAKPISWRGDSSPDLGTPPSWGEQLAVPAGESALVTGEDLSESFADHDLFQEFECYRNNSIRVLRGQLVMRAARDPRFGEKVVLRKVIYGDHSAQVRVRLNSEEGHAGLLLRANDCGVGSNRYRGYSAQVNRQGELGLFRCDGEKLTSLGKTIIAVGDDEWLTLQVVAVGSRLKVYAKDLRKPCLEVTDAEFARGQVGLLSEGANVAFDDFAVRVTQSHAPDDSSTSDSQH